MSLVSAVSDLATRIATEINSVRDALANRVAKGELRLNVTDPQFGAVADGVTNDAAAINAALTAASTAASFGPAVVWLPYTSTGYAASAIVLKANVILRGENRVLVKRTGGATSQFLTSGGASNITVEGLTLDSNGLSTVATVRAATGTQNFTLRDCKLLDSAQPAGVHAYDTQTGTSDLLIEDCWFDALPNNIRINQGPQRVTIRNSRFTNWTHRCIYVLGDATRAVHDLKIDDNTISDLVSSSTADVRQPITVQGQDTALHTRVRVRGNTVLGRGTSYNDATTPGNADLISLHRCRDFVVTDNFTVDGGDVGITIAQQCEDGVVTDNICKGNDTVGIALGSATSTNVRRITVGPNVLMNNGRNRNGDRPDRARAGAWVRLGQDIAISDHVLGDNQATKTQQYGVVFTDCINVKYGPDTDAGNALSLYHLDGAGNVDVGEAGEHTHQVALDDLVAAVRERLYEPGDLKISGTGAPSSGWLACDGAAISRTTYADLFNAIGTAFGAGDGSTTFNLPDLRNRAPMGVGSKIPLGGSDGLIETDRSLTHAHDIGGSTGSVGDHTHNASGLSASSTTLSFTPSIAQNGVREPVTQHTHSHNVTGNTGSSGAHSHSLPLGTSGYDSVMRQGFNFYIKT